MTPDMINASFEFAGSLVVCFSIFTIMKDKCYAGINIIHVGFFSVWGVWNVFYYPAIGQPWSFIAGCFLAAANVVYVMLLWWFPHRK